MFLVRFLLWLKMLGIHVKAKGFMENNVPSSKVLLKDEGHYLNKAGG